jgi:hypothetical protein
LAAGKPFTVSRFGWTGTKEEALRDNPICNSLRMCRNELAALRSRTVDEGEQIAKIHRGQSMVPRETEKKLVPGHSGNKRTKLANHDSFLQTRWRGLCFEKRAESQKTIRVIFHRDAAKFRGVPQLCHNC